MPVELMEWFRELEESALLLLEDGHLLLDPNNAERAFIIWWLREMARMPKHQQKCLVFGSVHPTVPVELDKEMPLLHLSLPRRETLGIIFDHVVSESNLQPHQIEKNEALLDEAHSEGVASDLESDDKDAAATH